MPQSPVLRGLESVMRDSSNEASSRSKQSGNPGALFVVCLGLFFGVVNGSAVAVVLPEIGEDLGIAKGDLPWILSGFLLTYGMAIPFFGRLAERFGARRLFLVGIAVFAIGSGLSAIAVGFGSLLAARTVQALGGAAVPGLGMTLAVRAFPEERRGFVLGVVSATMGLAAAVGPLVAGLISDLASWRWLFALSALAALNVPLGLKFLERNERLRSEPLGLLGGLFFVLAVVGALVFVSKGSQTGWTQTLTLSSGGIAVVAFAAFAWHQRRARAPFIPRSLVTNRGYLLLTLLGFMVTLANLAAQIGYPLLFSAVHDMSTLEIGVALVPVALTTAVAGVLAGRIVDTIGTATPVRVGAALMFVGGIAISTFVGTSMWSVALLATVFAAGFALVNTPLAAAVSLMVEPKDLASALSLNSMMFFVGGSFGTTLFSAIVNRTDQAAASLNPLHGVPGVGFSNAFLALAVPISMAFALSTLLGRAVAQPSEAEADGCENYVHDCQIPWSPELEVETQQ